MIGNRIQTTPTPGMTAANPPEGQPGTAKDAVAQNRLQRVRRASRLEATGPGASQENILQWGPYLAVQTNRKNHYFTD